MSVNQGAGGAANQPRPEASTAGHDLGTAADLTRKTRVSNRAQVASTRQPASPERVTIIVTSWSAIWSCRGAHGNAGAVLLTRSRCQMQACVEQPAAAWAV